MSEVSPCKWCVVECGRACDWSRLRKQIAASATTAAKNVPGANSALKQLPVNLRRRKDQTSY